MRLEGCDGPLLVLSNALGTTSELWRRQLPVLTGFRVLLYEHPPKASVDELGTAVLRELDALGSQRFAFCGLSLGGMVGMWLAASRPDRLDRLVLVSTSARFGRPEEWLERAALVRAEGMSAVAEDALDKWFTPAYHDREPFRRMQLETPPEDYAKGLEAIGGFDFRDQLERITAPTLVVAGSEDVATSPTDAAYLAERIPGARLVVLDGAAHLPNVERADRFNAALVKHLAAPAQPTRTT